MKRNILLKYKFVHPWILHEKKHILSKYTFVHLQHWMKGTHFIKIYISTTMDERETHCMKIHFWIPSILDENQILDEKKHILSKYKFVLQYWMKRTHFIKIYICTPSTLDERKHILSKYTFVSYQYWMKSINIRYCMKRNTFYQNTNLYTNIGWKEHILSKYTFVHLQHWMKRNTFLSKYTIVLPSILDEKKHILSKYTKFVSYQYWMKSINIGWKATHFGWKENTQSKYKFVLQYWMKRTHFIKIYICSPSTLDERKHIFIKIHNCMPSILHQKKHILSKYLLYPINIGWKASILDEKKHILSKYTFVLQYWMKRTHFIKIYICTPWILHEKKHLSKYKFVSNIR